MFAPARSEYWRANVTAEGAAKYGTPQFGGTIDINYEDPLDHFDIWTKASGVSDRMRGGVMETLVRLNPYDDTQIIPFLAEGWTISADTTRLVFFFEDGIKWHNGDDFKCSDALFAMDTMQNGVALGRITNSSSADRLTAVDSYQCIDAADRSTKALLVTLSGPNASQLLAFADRRVVVFQEDWFNDVGEDGMSNDMTVGTGPFKWTGTGPGRNVVPFEKNSSYHYEGSPYLDEIIWHGILDENIQLATQLAQATDWHWIRNFDQYDRYVAHEKIITVIRATRGHHGVYLNPRNAPFDNVNVRKAIMMTIDRGTAVEILQDGHGAEGFVMVPGSAWQLTQEQGCAVEGWCTPADGYVAQRARAVQILNDEGFDFDRTYEFTVEADEQSLVRSTFIIGQLDKAGIKIDPKVSETVIYRDLTEVNGGWADITSTNATMSQDDPALGMGQFFKCNVTQNYVHNPQQNACPQEWKDLFAQLERTNDLTARKVLSDELQLSIMNSYLRFPLYWEQEGASFWPWVEGYFHFPTPYGYNTFDQIWRNDSGQEVDVDHSGQISGWPGGI